MINIINKEDCCGCNACVQKCPTKCIDFTPDNQGFLYPHVNLGKCINCGLCEKVCPVINQESAIKPLKVFGAVNKNPQKLRDSSSGGVFISLASKIIENNGIVFGVKFDDNWDVIHSYTDNIKGLKAFQGSKYVQSRIGNSFLEVESFLKQGKTVMFSGTPCQISGLKRFLRKTWDNLITIEVMCHGVPSPLIWCDYLRTIEKTDSCIKNISFRDKRIDWENFGLSIDYTNSQKKEKCKFERQTVNPFMQGFLNDLYLRPSCFSCPSKSLKSRSDLTIGDFWHVDQYHPDEYNKLGVSLVLVNSEIGNKLYADCGFHSFESSYEVALKCVPSIENFAKRNQFSDIFWDKFNKIGIEALPGTLQLLTTPYIRFKRRIKNALGQNIITIIRKLKKTIR